MLICAHLISNASPTFSLVITQQILSHTDPFIAKERFMTVLEGVQACVQSIINAVLRQFSFFNYQRTKVRLISWLLIVIVLFR